MKNLILLLLLFNITFAFAQTKSSYYEFFTSKEDAIKEIKKYDRYLLMLNYKLVSENKISDYDYSRDWSFAYEGFTLSATVRYQFERRTFSVTMSNLVLSAGADSLELIPDETDPTKKILYDTLYKMFVEKVFEYIPIDEDKNDMERRRDKMMERPSNF